MTHDVVCFPFAVQDASPASLRTNSSLQKGGEKCLGLSPVSDPCWENHSWSLGPVDSSQAVAVL